MLVAAAAVATTTKTHHRHTAWEAQQNRASYVDLPVVSLRCRVFTVLSFVVSLCFVHVNLHRLVKRIP
uniref:Uncharacterized protein n=1 Tax=Hyaloperonospora arabidopsidis (strain Emoy2) TaxID=559515 RepID=M4BHE4_HYAAE